jgi:hypothetical protein
VHEKFRQQNVKGRKFVVGKFYSLVRISIESQEEENKPPKRWGLKSFFVNLNDQIFPSGPKIEGLMSAFKWILLKKSLV